MSDLSDRFVSNHKGAHISGVLLVALGSFLLISLATYSEYDAPAASQLVSTMNDSSHRTFNWAGKIGANTAYAAFIAIGYAAYVIPALSFLWGWNRLRRRPARPELIRSAGLLGFGLFSCLASGLPPYSKYLAFELGGWLGTKTASEILIPYTGRVGAGVGLGALFVVSAMMLTEVDPRRVAAFALQGWQAFVGWVAAFAATVRRSFTGLGSVFQGLRVAADVPENGRARLEAVEFPTGSRISDRQIVDGGADGGWDEDHEEEDDEGEEEEVEVEAADFPSLSGRAEAAALPVNPPAVTAPPAVPSTGRGNGTSGRSSTTKQTRSKNGSGGRYRLPATSLLDAIATIDNSAERDALVENAQVLEDALSDFDVTGKVVKVSPGPVVTRYEVEPAPGVKVNRIVTLSDDLARVMSAQGIRIQAPVPGKSVVGVEIANQVGETVFLREIIESSVFRRTEATLPMALGKTITGESFVADLAKMPHLLVAGSTGSGKSVCINSLIASILFKARPDEVRLLMIDPKVVELTMYNDIPHLLVPVVTEPKRASEALKWAVADMESRYQLLADLGVRNLADYNARVEKMKPDPDDDLESVHKRLPNIVIIIDEFSDLMLTAPADVETSLMSLAQKSRAVGIHIILATQRPSVNVITGVIKANFPSRIAFQVASKTDSRTILDMNGAERLLGRGDMLFLPSGQGEPIRIHGAFISGEETERLVESIKETNYEAEEIPVFFNRDVGAAPDDRDSLFDEAIKVVLEYQQASTSFLQRRLKVGYSRAARLMDELEGAGVVGPAEGAKPRDILVESGEVAAMAGPGELEASTE